MRYNYGPASRKMLWGGGAPSTIIKLLVITNLAIWGFITLTGTERFFFPVLGLVPRSVWESFMIWQPITYMFLHAGIMHVGLNMFVLWMFGSDLERDWGRDTFLRYYIITGAGAGLVTTALSLGSTTPVVGASGAIYGVLLAYGMAYPEREVYLYFMFPVKVKYLVVFLAAVAFFASLQPGYSTVSHLTHLSGMAIGWVYLRRRGMQTPKLFDGLERTMAQRKFRKELKDAEAERDLTLKVDRILDKINTSGYDSLTEDEKQTLYKASVKFSRRTGRD